MAIKSAAASTAAAGKGRGKGRGAGRGAPPAKKPRKYPLKLELKSGLSVDFLNTFLPADCRFGIDWFDGNWRLAAFESWYGRSWRRHGEEEGAKQLIRKAWEMALELGYETECTFAEFALS